MRRKDGFMWNAINYSPIPYGGLDKFLGPPFTKMVWVKSQHGSTVELWKWTLISSHMVSRMQLLIDAGIEVNPF